MTTLIIGLLSAGLSFLGASKGAKIQIESTEKSIKKDMAIAKMNIDEKLVAENKIAWANKTRELVAEIISICDDQRTLHANMGIKKGIAKIIPENMDVLSPELKSIFDENEEDTKRRMLHVQNFNRVHALLKLNLFEKTEAENQVLLKSEEIAIRLSKGKVVPTELLNDFIEASRECFEEQWKELTK